MQKSWGAARLRDAHEIALGIEQPDQNRARSVDPSFCVPRSDIAPMNRATHTLVGQHDRGELGQHSGERDDARLSLLGVSFQSVEAGRVVQRELSASRPSQRHHVSADSQALAEIVGERPDVETGGAVRSSDVTRPSARLTSSTACAVTLTGGRQVGRVRVGLVAAACVSARRPVASPPRHLLRREQRRLL